MYLADFEFNSRCFHSDSINWVGDSFAQFNSTRTRFNSIEFNSFCPKNFFRSRFSQNIGKEGVFMRWFLEISLEAYQKVLENLASRLGLICGLLLACDKSFVLLKKK